MPDTGMSYIGRKPCGCFEDAVAESCSDAPQFVAKMIRHGLVVERVTHDYVRQHFGYCTHKAPTMKPVKQLALLTE